MKKLIAVLMFSVAAFSYAQQKFALVIGNEAYTGGISRLNNPVNDANDMATALQGLGFTVDKVLNGSLDQMESAVMRLKNRLSVSKESYGFFFYAGHGVQSGGVNYLIPVGANIPSENYLRERAVSVQAMLAELNDAGNDLNVVVLDACRDNPFSWASARGGSRGLTVVGNQPADSIIVFATSAGSTASDGTGRNGLFTDQLLKNLRTPGLEVSEVFRLTGADVAQASNRQQIPAVYNQFFGRAYLGTSPAASTPAVQPTPQPAPTPAPAPATPAAPPVRPLSDNMVRINGGTFMMGSPANEPRRSNYEVQHRVTVSSFFMGKYEVTQEEYETVMGTNPSSNKGYNLPVTHVSWYDALVFCNRLSMREGLSPAYRINGSTDPAVWGTVPTSSNETWNAVIIMAGSNGYRLPTEAQWEYACRAGTTTPFSTGNNITTSQANYNGNNPYNNNAKGTYRERTTPVGSFAPNPWGLYDMHGNVGEWCWDRWEVSYSSGAQTDPAGPVSGTGRVSRGGAWITEGRSLRSANRGWDEPSSRFNAAKGFRLSRPL
jgi:formylglycine-generating enzyme required for sulfatase activity